MATEFDRTAGAVVARLQRLGQVMSDYRKRRYIRCVDKQLVTFATYREIKDFDEPSKST